MGQTRRLGPASAPLPVPAEDLPDTLVPHFTAAALDHAGIGVLHQSSGGHVLAVNARFCALSGHSAAELAASAPRILGEADRTGRFDALLLHQALRSEPFRQDVEFQHHDGTVRRCELAVSFPRKADGSGASTLVLATDLTAQREAEAQLREREDHYRSTIDLAPQISWTASPTGAIEEVSPGWADVTGIQPEDALGTGWTAALHPDDSSPTLAAWARALETRLPVDVEYRLRTPDGLYRWLRARGRPRIDAEGRVVRWYGTLEGIDDRKRAEQNLRESEERFRLAAQAARLGIWDFDAIRDRRSWSDDFRDMLGLSRDVEPNVTTALALVVPEDRHLLEALIGAVRAGRSEHRFEVTLRVRRADTGALRWMQTSGWRIEAPTGRLERILVTVRDVTEERDVEQRIRWTANHDALTSLPNRAHFNEMVEAAIERAASASSKLALVLFDVDNLKTTNDTVGHDAGDSLLLALGKRLAWGLGEGTVLARLGGDEFAALLDLSDGDDPVARIAATLESLREPLFHEGSALDCQATAGVSFFPADGGSVADLLKAADIALYAGKADRRGVLSTFHPDMRVRIQRRSSMLALARTAIRDDRIEPHYQPKVRLCDGTIAGFEALLRWRDDVLGLQSPDTIDAAFEDFRLATALGEVMFGKICADIRRWLDQGLTIGTVAFNLSAAEFRNDDLVDRILGRLRAAGIPPSMLELEITETVLLGGGGDSVAGTLNAFHREGVRIAFDDFGTGYASLTHLRTFPVDVIKIDRSFVANLDKASSDAAIVDTMIDLARRLDVEVVAEGIETRGQADYLADHGCLFGQGFLFGRAIPADRVESLLRGI